jgi:hypothetical protein
MGIAFLAVAGFFLYLFLTHKEPFYSDREDTGTPFTGNLVSLWWGLTNSEARRCFMHSALAGIAGRRQRRAGASRTNSSQQDHSR